MSLINQVLRDLDARRDEPAQSDQMALQGLGLAAGPGKDWRRLAVYVALVVGVAVLGLMAWQWQLKRASLEATPEIHLPLPEPVEPVRSRPATTPADPEARSKQQLTTEPTSTVKPAAAQPQPVVVEAAATVQKESQSKPETVQKTNITAEAPAPKIRKKLRPLTPEQKAELRYQQAVNMIRSGDARGAEQTLRATLDQNARHRMARMTLAGLLIDQGRTEPALAQMLEGLAVLPGDPHFAMLAGRLQLEHGDPGAAVGVLEQALPNSGQDPDYRAVLAAAYQQTGEHQRAAMQYRVAAELAPDNGNWWMGLGLAAEQAGSIQAARNAYEQALQVTLAPKLKRYVQGRLAALGASKASEAQ